jgi:hypothetical protein
MDTLQRTCYARWPCSQTKMERLGSASLHDTNLEMGRVRRDRDTQAVPPLSPAICTSNGHTKRVDPVT